MIPAALAVTLRVLSNPISNVYQKKLSSSGASPLFVNFMSYAILSLFCLVPALSVDWASFGKEFWTNAVIGGLFAAAGNGFMVLALKNGDLSILGPINSYKSIVGLVTAAVMLRELPTLIGLAGVCLIIWGSYFVFDTMEEGFSWRLLRNRQIVYRILAMILCAIEAVFDKKVILLSDVTVSFIVWCWFGTVFSLLMTVFLGHNPITSISSVTGRQWLMYIALVVCVGVMQFSTNSVFAQMKVGYGLALFQLSTIVSVLLGWLVFKESDVGKKLVGSVIMIAGSVLVILG